MASKQLSFIWPWLLLWHQVAAVSVCDPVHSMFVLNSALVVNNNETDKIESFFEELVFEASSELTGIGVVVFGRVPDELADEPVLLGLEETVMRNRGHSSAVVQSALDFEAWGFYEPELLTATVSLSDAVDAAHQVFIEEGRLPGEHDTMSMSTGALFIVDVENHAQTYDRMQLCVSAAASVDASQNKVSIFYIQVDDDAAQWEIVSVYDCNKQAEIAGYDEVADLYHLTCPSKHVVDVGEYTMHKKVQYMELGSIVACDLVYKNEDLAPESCHANERLSASSTILVHDDAMMTDAMSYDVGSILMATPKIFQLLPKECHAPVYKVVAITEVPVWRNGTTDEDAYELRNLLRLNVTMPELHEYIVDSEMGESEYAGPMDKPAHNVVPQHLIQKARQYLLEQSRTNSTYNDRSNSSGARARRRLGLKKLKKKAKRKAKKVAKKAKRYTNDATAVVDDVVKAANAIADVAVAVAKEVADAAVTAYNAVKMVVELMADALLACLPTLDLDFDLDFILDFVWPPWFPEIVTCVSWDEDIVDQEWSFDSDFGSAHLTLQATVTTEFCLKKIKFYGPKMKISSFGFPTVTDIGMALIGSVKSTVTASAAAGGTFDLFDPIYYISTQYKIPHKKKLSRYLTKKPMMAWVGVFPVIHWPRVEFWAYAKSETTLQLSLQYSYEYSAKITVGARYTKKNKFEAISEFEHELVNPLGDILNIDDTLADALDSTIPCPYTQPFHVGLPFRIGTEFFLSFFVYLQAEVRHETSLTFPYKGCNQGLCTPENKPIGLGTQSKLRLYLSLGFGDTALPIPALSFAKCIFPLPKYFLTDISELTLASYAKDKQCDVSFAEVFPLPLPASCCGGNNVEDEYFMIEKLAYDLCMTSAVALTQCDDSQEAQWWQATNPQVEGSDTLFQLQNKATGLCMDKSLTPVACAATLSQQWYKNDQENSGDYDANKESYRWKNKESGQCLIYHASSLYLTSCTDYWSNRWSFVEGVTGTTESIDSSAIPSESAAQASRIDLLYAANIDFFIENKQTQNCVSHADTDEFGFWSCDERRADEFFYMDEVAVGRTVADSTIYFRLRSRATGECMKNTAGSSCTTTPFDSADAAYFDMVTCGSGDNFLWSVDSSVFDDGSFRIMNKATNLCIYQSSDGEFGICTCSTEDTQAWTFDPVTGDEELSDNDFLQAVSVSIGDDGEEWLISSNNLVYRYDQVEGWTVQNGMFAQISVGSATNIWAVDSDNKIYKRKCCGVQYFAETVTVSSGNQLTEIAVRDDMHFEFDIVINSFPSQWASLLHCGSADAIRVPGIWLHYSLQQFHVAFSTLSSGSPSNNIGSLVTGQLYHFELDVTQSSLVITIDGVALYSNYEYEAHNTYDSVPCYAGDAWSQTTADVAVTNLVISYPNTIDEKTGVWVQTATGYLKQVSAASDGTVVGIGTDDTAWVSDSNGGTWTQLTTQTFEQVSVGSAASIYGVDAQQKIYKWEQSTSQWLVQSGETDFLHVSSSGDVWKTAADKVLQLPAPTDYVLIQGVPTEKCIFNSADGVFSQAPCDETDDAQLWQLDAQEWVSSTKTVHRLKNKETGLCVINRVGTGISYVEQPDDNYFGVTTCSTSTSEQQWYTDTPSDDNFRLVSNSNNHFMYVASDGRFGLSSSNNQVSDKRLRFVSLSGLTGTLSVKWADSVNDAFVRYPGHRFSQFAVNNDRLIGVTIDGEIVRQSAKYEPVFAGVAIGGGGGEIWSFAQDTGKVYRLHQTSTIEVADGGEYEWQSVGGAVDTQISIGNSQQIWAVNDGIIYRYQDADDSWLLVLQFTPPSSLAEVSAAPDGTVWARGSGAGVYEWNEATSNFDTVTGTTLLEIAVGSSTEVWGVWTDGNIVRRNVDTGAWETKSTASYARSLRVYVCDTNCTEPEPAPLVFALHTQTGNLLQWMEESASWQVYPWLLHSMDVDAGILVGIDFERNLLVKAVDNLMPRIFHVSMSADGNIWSLAEDDAHAYYVLQTDPLLDGGWKLLSKQRLQQISLRNSAEAWAVDHDNKVFKWNGDSGFEEVAGSQLKQVSVASDGTIFGITPDNTVMARESDAWLTIAGEFSQISVGSTSQIWATTPEGKVYKYNKAVDAIEGNIRLAGGSSSYGDSVYGGRVEIFHNGDWGTCCNDLMTELAATVICNQLGYSNYVDTVGFPGNVNGAISSVYGDGSGNIWLDSVQCAGTESTLAECPHASWGSHDCVHHEDIGISCSGFINDLPLTSVGNPGSNLGQCEGDCDSDSDCSGSLICYQRGGIEPVPGCSGSGDSTWDYCTTVSKWTDKSSSEFACASVHVSSNGDAWCVGQELNRIWKYESFGWVRFIESCEQMEVNNGMMAALGVDEYAGEVSVVSVQDLVPDTKQISIGADGAIFALSWYGYLYQYDPSYGDGWRLIDEAVSMKQISVGSASIIWAVDNNNLIYYRENDQWLQTATGGLFQVSAAADGTVVGIGTDDCAWVSDNNGGTWTQLTTQTFEQVSAGSATEIYAIDASNLLRWSGAAWESMGPHMTSVHVSSGGVVWSLDAEGYLWYASYGSYIIQGYLEKFRQCEQNAYTIVGVDYDGDIVIKPYTDLLPRVQHASIGEDGALWIVGSLGTVHRALDSGEEEWQNMDFYLSQISVRTADEVWGVDDYNRIWEWSSSTASWTEVGMGDYNGLAKQVSVDSVAGTGTVLSVDEGGVVRKFLNNGFWSVLPGSFEQVSVGSATNIYGVDSVGTVQKFDTVQNAWTTISGASSLRYLQVSANGIVWGVGYGAANTHIWKYDDSAAYNKWHRFALSSIDTPVLTQIEVNNGLLVGVTDDQDLIQELESDLVRPLVAFKYMSTAACYTGNPYVLSEFEGSIEECKAKCSEIGCSAFNRGISNDQYNGLCFFLTGPLSSINENYAYTDCYKAVSFTKKRGQSCYSSSTSLSDFVGNEETCAQKCVDLGTSCVAVVRVHSAEGSSADMNGKCYFKYPSITSMVTNLDRDCLIPDDTFISFPGDSATTISLPKLMEPPAKVSIPTAPQTKLVVAGLALLTFLLTMYNCRVHCYGYRKEVVKYV